jgi:FkbM family methyltransferase
MIKRIVKSAIPDRLWNSARNEYNYLRYSYLWFRREVVSFERDGSKIFLVIIDTADPIQGTQSRGQFYEEEELRSISPYFKRNGIFVDIGANTGQHSIYFAKLLGASKVILFEPILETCKILRENIRLNNLSIICDLRYLGLGLSDRTSRADFSVNTANLGGTILHERPGGSIQTMTGDSVIAGQRVDFIKIDTEGFEMKILTGLSETIETNRPAIYIEVDNANMKAFEIFLSETNYKIELRHKNYSENENFLILPLTQLSDG